MSHWTDGLLKACGMESSGAQWWKFTPVPNHRTRPLALPTDAQPNPRGNLASQGWVVTQWWCRDVIRQAARRNGVRGRWRKVAEWARRAGRPITFVGYDMQPGSDISAKFEIEGVPAWREESRR